MSSRFSDEHTRQTFIIGITDILSDIFEITEDSKKRGLYDELSTLDDARLIDKKGMIEDYFDQSHELALTHMNKLLQLEHAYREDSEKQTLQANI